MACTPLSQEDLRYHRDDSSHRQAVTGKFYWHSMYMGNFVPHLSHHTKPLRTMLKQDSLFHWDKMANSSFQKIKDLIAKSANQPHRHYDQTKPVTVKVDASQRGLGVCLVWEGQLPLPARALQTLRPSMPHQKGTPCHCICLPPLQHLCAG